MSSKTLLHFCAYSIIGIAILMPLLVLPAMVGTLVDEAAMTEAFAGWVASINFAGSAVAGLFTAFRIHRLDLREVATVTLVLTIGFELLSAYTIGTSSTFLIVRFTAGLMAGAAYSAAIAAFARHAEVERGFGIFITLQFIVSGIGLYILPVYSPQLGATGMYLMFAFIDVLALLCVGLLPGRAMAGDAPLQAGSERGVLLATVTIIAVVAYGLFEAANNAQFTYVERLAVSIGLTDAQIGMSLLVASLVGIPGAFAIVIVGQRFGRVGPLVFGIGVAIVGLLLLIRASNYASYFVGSCFMGFSWAFCLPYIQSMLAALDRHGSAIAAGAAVGTVGGAAGPGLAALVVGDGNYENVFFMAIAIFVITIASFVYAGRSPQYKKEEAPI